MKSYIQCTVLFLFYDFFFFFTQFLRGKHFLREPTPNPPNPPKKKKNQNTQTTPPPPLPRPPPKLDPQKHV